MGYNRSVSDSNDIYLHQTYPIAEPSAYKLHLARWNGSVQPLDVFVRNREEWNDLNRWRSDKDDFNRPYIFSLIDFYPQRDLWLFGGAYRILDRDPTPRAHSYKIEILPESEPLIGRVKVRLNSPGRIRSFKFENHYGALVLEEILAESYTGEPFCGYDRVHLSFAALESIIANQRSDWKVALQHAKGVYMITDESNGKRYVGSAYGADGLWTRWQAYIETGHGHNVELCKIIAKAGLEYARRHFRFAFIEHMLPSSPDDLVLQREAYWKGVLLTRGDYGYNRN